MTLYRGQHILGGGGSNDSDTHSRVAVMLINSLSPTHTYTQHSLSTLASIRNCRQYHKPWDNTGVPTCCETDWTEHKLWRLQSVFKQLLQQHFGPGLLHGITFITVSTIELGLYLSPPTWIHHRQLENPAIKYSCMFRKLKVHVCTAWLLYDFATLGWLLQAMTNLELTAQLSCVRCSILHVCKVPMKQMVVATAFSHTHFITRLSHRHLTFSNTGAQSILPGLKASECVCTCACMCMRQVYIYARSP